LPLIQKFRGANIGVKGERAKAVDKRWNREKISRIGGVSRKGAK
jgi:hypothetical protein